MINEILFALHIVAILCTLFVALALGPEALTATICMLSIISNLFVTKQITLFGLNVVTTDVCAVGAMLALNMLQEFFGRKAVNKTIIINFFVTLVYLAMSQFQVWYQPNTFDTMNQHFVALLAPIPRIVIASIVVYVIVQIIDAQLYGFFKRICNNKYVTGRNIVSLLVSQLIDTVLFSFLGLYGLVESLLHIIVISYVIKIVVIFCNAPFIRLAHYIGKKHHDTISL